MPDLKSQNPTIPLEELQVLRGGAFSLLWWDSSAGIIPPTVSYPDPEPVEEPESGGAPVSAALAVDFGTSTIAAAVAGEETEVLWFRQPDGAEPKRMLDAPVGRRRDLGRALLAENYKLDSVVGQDSELWSYYPCLKRRIELLARVSADQEWQAQAALDVAGVCYRALSIAEDQSRTPLKALLSPDSRVYVSVPNAFPDAGVEVIREGVGYAVAAILGSSRVPDVFTLLEAEAVAYGELLRPRLGGSDRLQDPILVIDAGAGTTDASILRRVGDMLQVVAHAGLPVGGIDLDAFIASLDGSLRDLGPHTLSQRLRTARENKERYWRQGNGTSGEDEARQAMESLARVFADDRAPPDDPLLARRRDDLVKANRRYLALAAHALILSLPEQELAAVRNVILSGRSSLVLGFSAAVQAALERRGIRGITLISGTEEDRKLAVVRGVGAYHQAAGTKVQRRPLRATFPVVLDHSLDQEEQIIEASHPLVGGWGVAAWRQPADGTGLVKDWILRSRLVTVAVIEELHARGHLRSDGEHDEVASVLKWSRVFLTRFPRKPPFSARLAYDFLSRKVALEIDGRPVTVAAQPVDDAASRLFSRFHPIHQLEENWFETHHARRG